MASRWKITKDCLGYNEQSHMRSPHLTPNFQGCFFRQFYRSMGPSTPGRNFDFQKYIKRSLDVDFKVCNDKFNQPQVWEDVTHREGQNGFDAITEKGLEEDII